MQWFIPRPEVPSPKYPQDYLYSFGPDVVVAYDTYYDDLSVANSEPTQYPTVAVNWTEFESHGKTLSEAEIEKLNQKKDKLTTEIKTLEAYKKDLKDNLVVLEEKNNALVKICEDYQMLILEFVERNKIRDILTSAFVGALVSAVLSFILRIPRVRKKIRTYMWHNYTS